nr:ABC transporter ATP-binding protein [Roseomonas marmotae]
MEGVTRRFGQTVAVHPLDLSIGGGEMLALLGPSGCGKTTTLRMVAGFEQPDAGRVIIGGEDVTPQRPARRRLGMVFQNYSLFPHMTVAENVAFGLRMQSVPRPERDRRVRAMLELVQLAPLENRRPAQLSGGQQQRVALARSLITEPRVLLLDEPLGALDKNLRESMQFELRSLQRRLGITTLLVTHDQEEALSMSDRVAVMRAGRVVQAGAPASIYDRPATRFVAAFLGTSNLFSGAARQGEMRLGAGGTIRLPDATAQGAAILSVRPERIAVGEQAQGLDNSFDAVVRSAAFRGSFFAYELEAPALGQVLYAYRHPQGSLGEAMIAPGAGTRLGWRAEDGVIVEEDQ